MEDLKQQIQEILKQLEIMIKKEVDKEEIEKQRKELDYKLEKYLKDI